MSILVRRKPAGSVRYLRVPLEATLAARLDALRARADAAGFDLAVEDRLARELDVLITQAEAQIEGRDERVVLGAALDREEGEFEREGERKGEREVAADELPVS